jgi:hypothetical protein
MIYFENYLVLAFVYVWTLIGNLLDMKKIYIHLVALPSRNQSTPAQYQLPPQKLGLRPLLAPPPVLSCWFRPPSTESALAAV